MSAITTHVLDTSVGKPAARVSVKLEVQGVGGWQTVASARTDADGRAAELLSRGATLVAGTYRLWFDTGEYYLAQGVDSFYPHVEIVFEVKDAAQHYHVALLLAPFSYSTYRGS
jgi:5-hydroxyisourate hydrolase